MKILFETYNTFAQNVGSGVKTRIYSLHNALTALGCEVDFFDKWTTKVDNYDIIHFFKAHIDNYNLMNHAKSLGKKIVLSSIVPLDEEYKILFNRALCRILPVHTTYDLTQRILKISDCIITQSSNESSFLHKYYGINIEKTIALPNGANTSITGGIPDIIRQELPFTGDFVLQVGRIDRNKNQLATIRALKGTNIHLVIVGGPAQNEMAYYEQCRSEANDNVYFTGWLAIEDERLASCYAAAKILILPSLHETFGNVLIEGAINECLLSCSNSLPITEWPIMKPYITTFSPKSTSDIRMTISNLLNKDVPHGQSEVFKNFFSWNRIAEEHIKIYRSLLS